MGNAIRFSEEWFTPITDFLVDENSLAQHLNAPLDEPIRLLNLQQLGVSSEIFIQNLGSSFSLLEEDISDVKRRQLQIVTEELYTEHELPSSRVNSFLQNDLNLNALLADLPQGYTRDWSHLQSLSPWRCRSVSQFQYWLYDSHWNIKRVPVVGEEASHNPLQDWLYTPDSSEMLTHHPDFRYFLRAIGDLLRSLDVGLEAFQLICYQERILAHKNQPGLCYPAGISKGEADYVIVGPVIGRSQIEGGELQVTDEALEVEFLRTRLQEGQMVLLSERSSPYWHFLNPINLADGARTDLGCLDLFRFEVLIDRRSSSYSTRGFFQNPDSLEGGVGAFSIPFHREMVADKARVTPFRKAIENVSKEKIVLECGAGTGIMSLLSARAGAKKVYSVEIDPRIAQLAEQNFTQSDYADRMTLIRKPIQQVRLDDLDGQRPTVVIVENLSTWLVTEPQLVNMNYILRELAAPQATILPSLMHNKVALAYVPFRFEDLVTVKTYYFEFTGIEPAELQSQEVVFNTFDFRKVQSRLIDETVRIKASADGLVNSLRLTSELDVFEGIRFDSSDTLLPPVVLPLDDEIEVSAGETLDVRIQFHSYTSWEEVKLWVSKAN